MKSLITISIQTVDEDGSGSVSTRATKQVTHHPACDDLKDWQALERLAHAVFRTYSTSLNNRTQRTVVV